MSVMSHTIPLLICSLIQSVVMLVVILSKIVETKSKTKITKQTKNWVELFYK